MNEILKQKIKDFEINYVMHHKGKLKDYDSLLKEQNKIRGITK